MPRPLKCRRVCQLPQIQSFEPSTKNEVTNEITMTVDEFETIRLIDKEGFSQEECSKIMNVARTTVQQIYETARKKIADAIVNGYILKIEGGNYKICSEKETGCHRKCCKHRRCQ